MGPYLAIGTKEHLDRFPTLPEFLSIDREIGKPYMEQPLLYNSQAWSRRLELPWAAQRILTSGAHSVLDVGSGDSALPIFLQRSGMQVVSVDPVIPDHLRRAVGVARAGLPYLPFRDASFDAVCCISVLEHLPFGLEASFGELCRVARQSVVLTLDVAMGPLARYGISPVELNLLARNLRTKIDWPYDPLTPAGPEARSVGSQTRVCLAFVDRPQERLPLLRLGKWQRTLVRIHRVFQEAVWFQWRLRKRLKSRERDHNSDVLEGR
jgi:SAM-dependent methyltransferase